MPIPHRKPAGVAADRCAAYLDVRHVPLARTWYGGLFLTDARGQPLEFVHNTLTLPAGGLWSGPRAALSVVGEVGRSLFDACRREPDLLLCLDTLGEPEDLLAELAPAVPFGQVKPGTEEQPAEWIWINDPPSSGMAAARLHAELIRRGLLLEPFARLRLGLAECYQAVPWDAAHGSA